MLNNLKFLKSIWIELSLKWKIYTSLKYKTKYKNTEWTILMTEIQE